MSKRKCPNCGGELFAVTRPSDSYLSPDQFDAVRAGDFYCMKCPSNDRGNTGYWYFWERELMDAKDAQIAALTERLRAELERKDAALREFDWALGQLRHLYIQNNLNAGLKNGLLGPQIERLEKVRAALQPKEPPCQTI